MTNPFPKSDKYARLIDQYSDMAQNGYDRRNGPRIEQAYDSQEAFKFRDQLKTHFAQHSVASVLDYGAGAMPWTDKIAPNGQNLLAYTGAETYLRFEPSRDIDERQPVDAVVCFDVLEHVYIADIAYTLEDILSHARRLVVLNVACYAANALLPTGENAHITIRSPQWWRGAVDIVAARYPEVEVALYCSKTYTTADALLAPSYRVMAAKPGFSR